MATSDTKTPRVADADGTGTFEELRGRMRGSVILPGDPEYDAARQVFNAMIDCRPAAIARCAGTEDVVEAVRFARRSGIALTVRGGGHGVAGNCVRDGALVIDLAGMTAVEVDPAARVGRVQGGARLGQFITSTERYGLVSPTGTVSDTGVGGLTLGAGFGYLCGKYGLAIDNLLGAEVVTADGQVLDVSAVSHPDLFWALRGGSGNFGVVTRFDFALHLLSQVLGGLLVHPFSRAREALRFFRDTAATVPEELTIYAAMLTGPDGNKAVGFIACWCGEPDEGERVLAPIRAFGPPVADLIHPMPYSEMNTIVEAASPPGLRDYWKQSMLRQLSDEAIDAFVDLFERVPSARTVIVIDLMHGAVHRVPSTATAFPHRDARHNLVMLSMWDDPADDERNIAWTRELAAAARPFSTGGVYVNEPMDETPRSAFAGNTERLAAIKRRYDPENVFQINLNFAPATAP